MKAFPSWAARAPRERAEILRKALELIMADQERLARLITMENGKALPDARGEVAYAAEFFRWYAEEAVRNRRRDDALARERRAHSRASQARRRRRPRHAVEFPRRHGARARSAPRLPPDVLSSSSPRPRRR